MSVFLHSFLIVNNHFQGTYVSDTNCVNRPLFLHFVLFAVNKTKQNTVLFFTSIGIYYFHSGILKNILHQMCPISRFYSWAYKHIPLSFHHNLYLFYLVFHIASEPQFGYIEDRTPREGYEKTIGKQTSSFTYDQLMAGHIKYVQSNHLGIEPTSDEFSVFATDGEHNSATV